MKQKKGLRIVNGKIDLASFTGGIRGLDVEIGRHSITLTRRWRRGKTEGECQCSIKRYVTARIARMLGLYRSDGQKDPQRLRFTNNDPILHKAFIDPLREMGVKNFIAHVYYCYCEKCGPEKLEKAILEFERMTGVKVTGRHRNELAHNPIFITDVNSKPLAIFIKHAEKVLRKQMVRGNISKDIVKKYVRGVLEGDGSINIRIKENKVDGMYILTFETDDDAVADILKIFEKYFSIKLKTYPERHVPNGRQMKSINLDDLLQLLSDGVIPSKYFDKIAKRIAIALQKKDTPWILLKLFEKFKNGWFSSKEASEILSKPCHHILERLKKLEKKGYLISMKKKIDNNRAGTPVRRLFKLAEKGRKIVKTLRSLPSLFLSPFTLPFTLICTFRKFYYGFYSIS